MQIKKIILLSLTTFIILFIGFFIYTSLLIGKSVKKYCQSSRQIYKQENCVDNLISYLEDEENSLKDKNHIVWALGQLGNHKALPYLEKYYKGEECDHEKYLCQYELEKAIKLIKSEFNATSFVWRHNID